MLIGNVLCPMCKKVHYLRVSKDQKEQYINYTSGQDLIQNVLTSFDDFEREFVKTGYCPKCQSKLFDKKLADPSKFFCLEDDIRNDVIEKFINDAAKEFIKYGVLDCRKSILSPSAEQLSVNEKLLYLYEFDLEDEFEVDLNTGKVLKRYKEKGAAMIPFKL